MNEELFEQLFGLRRLDVEGLDSKLLGLQGHEGVYRRAGLEEIPEQLQRLRHAGYDTMHGLPWYLPKRFQAGLQEDIRATTFYGRTDVAVFLCRLSGLHHEAALYLKN